MGHIKIDTGTIRLSKGEGVTMIQIVDKKKCCGCGACVSSCPKICIDMKQDIEGFMYPVVDEKSCIQCGRCDKACHIQSDICNKNSKYSCEYYCAFNKQDEIIAASSSGGIFWILVEWIIGHQGVVYGAELKENFYVVHGRGTSLYECEKFRKSKYLQSDTTDIFPIVKEDLQAGSIVLFSGTPCQIAALYHYLGKDYPTLYTCDVVCHGVPSKAIFDKYISELNIQNDTKAVRMEWRDKREGWGPNRVSVQFENGKEIITTSAENAYQKGFLTNLYLRSSCYSCQYAKLPRVGDISLADFWGYDGKLLSDNANKGLSAIIISSDKGKELLKSIENSIVIEAVTKEYLTARSRHAYLPPEPNPDRSRFLKKSQNCSFSALSKKYIYISHSREIYRKISSLLRKCRGGL